MKRLKIVKTLINKGEMTTEMWKNNTIWEHNDASPIYGIGWVECIGVQCSKKTLSTTHECPISAKKCWWVELHNKRLAEEAKRKKQQQS